MDFCEKLLMLRKERGLSQEAVAKHLDITLRQYFRFEKGEQKPGYAFQEGLRLGIQLAMESLFPEFELWNRCLYRLAVWPHGAAHAPIKTSSGLRNVCFVLIRSRLCIHINTQQTVRQGERALVHPGSGVRPGRRAPRRGGEPHVLRTDRHRRGRDCLRSGPLGRAQEVDG